MYIAQIIAASELIVIDVLIADRQAVEQDLHVGEG